MAEGATTLELVVSPFGADAREMVEVARCADQSGFAAVWTLDHLTGSMLDRSWSHDPFTVLGAMANATDHVRLGPLVANMMNRHPVQLALAMASLQSLSRGRAVLGLGAGASPGSRWAGEHEAIATPLLRTGEARRRHLIETIQVLDALWAGADSFDGEFFTVDAIGDVVGETERPPIVLGAGSRATVGTALRWADGVNLLPGPGLSGLVELIDQSDRRPGFIVSVFGEADLTHPLGGKPSAVFETHPEVVTARALAVRAPFDLSAIANLGRAS